MIRSRARTGTAEARCFQRVFSLFSLCYLLLEKLSKSLIPLSDCPFVLNRLPVFLGKSPCFPELRELLAFARFPPVLSDHRAQAGPSDASYRVAEGGCGLKLRCDAAQLSYRVPFTRVEWIACWFTRLLQSWFFRLLPLFAKLTKLSEAFFCLSIGFAIWVT